MILSTVGEDDEKNRLLLQDVNWDINFLYASDFMHFASNLVSLVAGIRRITGPVFVGDSGSDDED